MIETFVILALAATGITLVLVKSKLFRPLRENISWIYEDTKKENAINYDKKTTYNKTKEKAYWFINSIFNCGLCMGVWASGVSALFAWMQLWWLLYTLASITIVGLLTKIYEQWM